jgi:Cu-processing system permease protein
MVLGWYVSTFMVGSLAIVTGAGSISQEVENGTILGLASSPLSRRSIVLGKYTAYALVSSLYSTVLLISIMALSGYFCRLIFEPYGVAAAVVVFTLFPLALLAVTMALSAIFTTMSAGIIAFMIFVVSIIGGFVEQIGALMGNGALINIGIVSSLIMPSDAVYRLAVDLASRTMAHSSIVDFGPFGTASTPSTLMLVYTIVYLGIWLTTAVHNFEKRDL